MGFFKRKQEQPDEKRLPDFSDDHTYVEDLNAIAADLPGERAGDEPEAAEESGEQPMPATRYAREQLTREMEQRERGKKGRGKRKARKAESPLDADENEVIRRAPTRLRTLFLWVVTLVLSAMLLCTILATVSNIAVFSAPGTLIARVMTPVQNAFSTFTDVFTDYARTLKLRAALEEQYTAVVALNEELTYKALLADELQLQLAMFENMYDEVNQNKAMNPIVCRVIGRTDGNYFSTFTINRGRRDGIEEYMAVTISGALVGYTEKVTETQATVRTIIDSEASIAGLIQSSRDQGTVRGTLGINGTAMCRMYYLPDNSLPRPGDIVVTSGVGMSFPKGIPIGVVRESTRGMESNKSYVVVEPSADFQHLEYVIVLRYKPAAQAIQGNSNVSSYMQFVPTETARPYPTLRMFSSSFYSATASPVPDDYVSPTPPPTSSPTPSPTPRPTPSPTPADTAPVLEYHPVHVTPSATPLPTATPSPTPVPTIDLGSLTYEED